MGAVDIQSVRQLIADAFACTVKQDQTPLSHEECVQLREDIVCLCNEDFVATLPEIFIDVLDTYTSGQKDLSSIDLLVTYLDASEPDDDDIFSLPEAEQKRLLNSMKQAREASGATDKEKMNDDMAFNLLEGLLSGKSDFLRWIASNERDEEHLESKLELFSMFTRDQSFAVCEWLRCIRDWPELAMEADTIDCARSYWSNRVKSLGENT